MLESFYFIYSYKHTSFYQTIKCIFTLAFKNPHPALASVTKRLSYQKSRETEPLKTHVISSESEKQECDDHYHTKFLISFHAF